MSTLEFTFSVFTFKLLNIFRIGLDQFNPFNKHEINASEQGLCQLIMCLGFKVQVKVKDRD